LQPVERLESSTNLDLVIGLPLRNQEALTNLLQQQYAPTSPQYHHWLTPDEFAAKFGPTEQDYQAVIEFAKANGFTITGTHPNRTLVDVRGSVADIERAFRVTLLAYQHPTEAREFYAPDVEPSFDLTVPVLHITGLDNYSVPRPVSIREAPQNKPADATPASGSGPSGSYIGYDFISAYVPGVSLNGSGQVVALVELDGYYPNDITAYESQAGLPAVPLQNVLLDGFRGTPTANAHQVQEVSLDIEMAISMAPGLSKVVVYEASNVTANVEDVLNRIATDNLAKQISSSWQFGNDATNLDQIYQEYAMQGQSFFQASGDNGAFTNRWLNQQQSDSPYVTLVGGTTLTTTGPEGDWLSEKVWNWNTGTGLGETNGASGGGIGTSYSIPSWQTNINMSSNGGSRTKRNVPDVAMVADGIYVIYNNGSTASGVGGTSCAAPLWAGFTALVNQQAEASSQPTVGFINPVVYAIGTGPTYAACFHDIISGNNETYYSPLLFSAVPGYDLCTGWGTPTGSNLVNTLLPQPDLTRGTDSLTNVNPHAGDTVTVSISITNQSCPAGGTSAGAFLVGFYWSTDSNFFGVSAFYEAPVSGCADEGSVSITQNIMIARLTAPGIHYLGYNIDDSNEVAECDKDNNGIYYWSVNVLPPCTFPLSTTNAVFDAAGGSGSVSVSASNGCAWTATSNDGFITIISGSSGTGNGTVNYSVAANTSSSGLTGTMIIAGQTFTVTQSGAEPSGEFNYAFKNTPLWDVSGIYTNNLVTNDVVIAEFQLAANGQITGTRTEVYNDGTDSAEGTASILGRVFDKAATVGFRFNWKGVYTGVSGGIVANANMRDTVVVVPSTLTVTDVESGRVCAFGGKCERVTQSVSLPLPAGMNGDWTLDLNIVTNGNKRAGTGTLTLSNGRVLTYQIVGSYNAKSQLSKLKLVGESEATGSSLSLTTHGAGMNLTGLKGKVLGQTLKYP
jgi:hypothetical protein